MAKTPPREEAQASPDEKIIFTGEEALARLKDFTQRILAVPKDEAVTPPKRPKRKRA